MGSSKGSRSEGSCDAEFRVQVLGFRVLGVVRAPSRVPLKGFIGIEGGHRVIPRASLGRSVATVIPVVSCCEGGLV